jgi:hypothetical protein
MSGEVAELLASVVVLWGAAVVSYLSILAQQEARGTDADEPDEAAGPSRVEFSPSWNGCRGGLNYERRWWDDFSN